MCGIFGYIGAKDIIKTCIEGLKKLEYRGYDSAGIAGVKNGELYCCKTAGKVVNLEEKITLEDLDVAVAHTRWATHGKPTEVNAHPHTDNKNTLALVHNGIIENYQSLRQKLSDNGIKCNTETDTEVIVQLISMHYEGDILKALQETMPLLCGSFAIALVHKDYPDQIITATKESPLAIGIGNGETFIASDTSAFMIHTKDVIFLEDGEIAIVKRDGLQVYDETMEQVLKEKETLEHQFEEVDKGTFKHFMLKEIYEQPQSLRNACLSRFMESSGTACLDDLHFDASTLHDVKRILIVACGTSWHAGLIAAYMIEDKARIPVQVEIASELRYKNPIVQDGTIVIAISQSGETADTIAAMRELKAKGAKIVAVCNAHGSTIAREADSCLFLRAGVEIGVASTKAFTSQLVVLFLFSLLMARMREMSKADGKEFIEAIKLLPNQVKKVLSQSEWIETIAKKYSHLTNFFFLGRRYMFPTGLEAALKLKEIAYVHANGYPAGEMKHGPIALIDENCLTIAFCADKLTYEKIVSNLMEIKARGGPILAIAPEGSEGLEEIADDIIWMPRTLDGLSAIPSTVAAQLFAYYSAKERGTEIDQPRNLAKSVTVE